MSINCWFVFQIDAPSKKARAELLQTCRAEIESFDLDRVIMLYQGHRYPAFTELDAEERSEIVERCLGDSVIARLTDKRGVCVIPEVGQDMDEQTYAELVSEPDNLWVTCRANSRPGIEKKRAKLSITPILDLLPDDAEIKISQVHPGSRDTRRLADGGWELVDEKINPFTGTFHLKAEKSDKQRVLIYFDEDFSARILGLL